MQHNNVDMQRTVYLYFKPPVDIIVQRSICENIYCHVSDLAFSNDAVESPS